MASGTVSRIERRWPSRVRSASSTCFSSSISRKMPLRWRAAPDSVTNQAGARLIHLPPLGAARKSLKETSETAAAAARPARSRPRRVRDHRVRGATGRGRSSPGWSRLDAEQHHRGLGPFQLPSRGRDPRCRRRTLDPTRSARPDRRCLGMRYAGRRQTAAPTFAWRPSCRTHDGNFAQGRAGGKVRWLIPLADFPRLGARRFDLLYPAPRRRGFRRQFS